MTDVDALMGHLAELMTKREERWRWENIDPVVRAEFASRVDPGIDPGVDWDNRTVRLRRELDWHLRRRVGKYPTASQEDSHRLQMEADEASVRAFHVLIEIMRPTDGI